MIELIIEPRKVKTWEDFCKENPNYSIAIDGYVCAPSKEDNKGLRLNLNDHEGTNGLTILSTSAQAWIRIKLGLFERFKKDGEETAYIYMNDIDQDASLSAILLKDHKKFLETEREPLIEQLVDIENRLDITAGTYPFNPDSEIMQNIAWIFQPYTDSRRLGYIETMNASSMKNLVEKISERIDAYSLGRANRIKISTDYEILLKEKGWALVYERGENSKMKLSTDGIKSFVSIRKLSEDIHIYSIFNMIPLTSLSAKEFYEKLNHAEGIFTENGNQWGGGSFKGGSPREIGSKIKPKDFVKLINSLIDKNI